MVRWALAASFFLGSAAWTAEFPEFREHVVNGDAGTGLAITVADIDNDGKPDIVGVSGSDVAWYENPSWERHLIADRLKGSNVCIAPRDLDGDGTPEFALGADWQFNNTTSGGALYLLRSRGDVRKTWEAIVLLDKEPTLHRIRWIDTDSPMGGLVVAPLKGPGTSGPAFQERGVRLFMLTPAARPFEAMWRRTPIDDSLYVVHNIWPVTELGDPPGLAAASFEGVTYFERDGNLWRAEKWAEGNPEPLPNSGAGEIKTTLLPSASGGSGDRDSLIFATIEPWHGHQVVVYAPDANGNRVRTVLDDTLAGGHAIWWADFDQDGQDELLCGYREPAGPNNLPGLNVYDLSVDRETGAVSSTKYVVDEGGMATEDAVAADFNGDGWPDIAAFGRATKNIKYYENQGGK